MLGRFKIGPQLLAMALVSALGFVAILVNDLDHGGGLCGCAVPGDAKWRDRPVRGLG
jgi:hypothetical protein